MAEERISSVVAPSAFDEVKRLGDDIVALEKKANSIDIKIGDTNSIRQMSAELKELFSTTNQVQQAVKAQEAARKSNNQVEKDSIALQKQLEAAGKANMKMLLDLEKAKKREHKLNQEASSDYKILSKAYQDAALRAKDYNLQLGKQHPLTIQATEAAQEMGARLKQLDASVGQYQRNVGNYNMVGSQFNQLLREAPNFAISMRTGIMALTNNVTYFAESVKLARAQGQSWMQVIKSVGSSMFGLVGILNIAILLITYWALNADKAGSATDKLAESTDRYNDAMLEASKTSTKNATNEIDRLKILNSIATDVTASLQARTRAAQEMQDLYPSVLANYSQEAILAGKVAGEIEAITKAILVRAQAEVAAKKLEATEERILDLRMQQRTAAVQLAIAEGKLHKSKEDATGVTYALAAADRATARARIRDIKKEMDMAKGLRDNYLQYAKEAAQASFDEIDISGGAGKTPKETTEEIAAEIDYRMQMELDYSEALRGSIAIQTQDKIDAIDKVRAAETDQLQWLEMSLASGAIKQEEYEERKLQIAKKYAIARAEVELAYAQSVLKYTTDPKAIRELTQEIENLRLKIAELNNELGSGKGGDSAKEDYKQLIKILQAIDTITTNIFGIESDRHAARMKYLQEEGKAIEDNGRREIERIQRSGLTQEEQQEAIRRQEALTESQRIANEQRQREAARKKAQADKAAAISSIILNTGIAVIKALVDGATPIDKAIGAGLAAAVGAAQLARAASAPLPQYAGGTLDHKGGKFIAGEKESELVIRPDGRAYWTKDTATVYDEPKHTKVFNQEQINRIAMASLNPAMIAALKPRRDEDFTKHIVNAVEKTGRNTVRAIAQNRANVNVHQQSIDFYYLSKVKGRA